MGLFDVKNNENLKSKKTKVLELSKLTEEQKEALKNIGLL